MCVICASECDNINDAEDNFYLTQKGKVRIFPHLDKELLFHLNHKKYSLQGSRGKNNVNYGQKHQFS